MSLLTENWHRHAALPEKLPIAEIEGRKYLIFTFLLNACFPSSPPTAQARESSNMFHKGKLPVIQNRSGKARSGWEIQ